MKTRHFVVTVVLFIFILLAGAAFAATAPVAPQWVKQFGSAQIDYARELVTDASGNVYVAGTTHGAINADTQLVPNTNKGGTDVFVAKFDPQGSLLWVIQFGSMTTPRGSPSASNTATSSSMSRDRRKGAFRAVSSKPKPDR
jgi:hypothetical protein